MARSEFDNQIEAREYSPTTFYTRSQDDKGHSINLRVTIPVNLSGMIGFLVESPAWPEYRTSQDVLRDALVHRLEWVSAQTGREQVPSIREALQRERLLARLDAERADAARRTDMEKALVDMVTMKVGDGDLDGALKILGEAEAVAADMAGPYRARFVEMIRELRANVDARP